MLAANQLTLARHRSSDRAPGQLRHAALTLEQVLADGKAAERKDVSRFLAEKMVVNIHERGNCSVVCMPAAAFMTSRAGPSNPIPSRAFPINRNLQAASECPPCPLRFRRRRHDPQLVSAEKVEE